MKLFSLLVLMIAISFACTKGDNTNGIPISGTWTFRSQISGAFQYPNNNVQPAWNEAYTSSVIVSSCDCKSSYFKFDNVGHYTLVGSFGQPPSFISGPPPSPTPIDTLYGIYKVIDDSLLIVQPDTVLLKSSYAYRANYPFPNGDSIRIRKIGLDSLQFIQRWTASYNDIIRNSIIPASYISISGFKKIQ